MESYNVVLFWGEVLASFIHETLLYTLSDYLKNDPLSRNRYSERLSPKFSQLNSGSVGLGGHAFPVATYSLAGAPLPP